MPLPPSTLPAPARSLNGESAIGADSEDDLVEELLDALRQYKLQQAMLGETETHLGFEGAQPEMGGTAGSVDLLQGTNERHQSSPGSSDLDDAMLVTGEQGPEASNDILLLDIPSPPPQDFAQR